MTNWITDEHGNQTFTHGGWTVRIWSPGCSWNRINVDTPGAWGYNHYVEVGPEGIFVNGESSGGYSPSAFTIPWEVIGAIIEARQIVAEGRKNFTPPPSLSRQPEY